MITERVTFRAKYGRGDELIALMKGSPEQMPMEGVVGTRLYTDFTGAMFTVAMEFDYEDLDSYAAATKAGMAQYGNPEFENWFKQTVELTEGGEKQLFNSEKLM
jgi:hypothetical protein